MHYQEFLEGKELLEYFSTVVMPWSLPLSAAYTIPLQGSSHFGFLLYIFEPVGFSMT
jgi:hypothetical protein